jgi:hypothetical protein
MDKVRRLLLMGAAEVDQAEQVPVFPYSMFILEPTRHVADALLIADGAHPPQQVGNSADLVAFVAGVPDAIQAIANLDRDHRETVPQIEIVRENFCALSHQKHPTDHGHKSTKRSPPISPAF